MNSKMYLILAVYVIGLFVSPLLADEPLWKTLPPPQAMPEADKSGSLKINNISLHYGIYGKGKPLILLHGGLGHSDFWSNQVLELQKNHQVIVIDSRGHGRSSSDKQAYSYHLMASDVLGVMDALSISKADLLGWSDGGLVNFFDTTQLSNFS
ncbi:MAG: alpha/beta fold hydrolase [Gammaproteobacteria bacterium]|nr:alpha/beta fold hydrolase [Gammaproteobacteria bacterium]